MKKLLKNLLIVGALSMGVLAFFAPVAGAAAPKFYYAGWIPFWNKTPGVRDITDNLDSKLNEISPFSYEVRYDGSLVDKLKINEGFWPNWLSAVHDLKIKIIPTVAWFDGAGIHRLLASGKSRRAQEDAIAALARLPNFDGVDIDYEAKESETKDYFSLFIKGLYLRLHPFKKTLSCTVEARTPVSSAHKPPYPKIERANDYEVLNKYCDEVRVMAYDQGFIDLKLNEQKGSDGKLYAPVADPDWVKKVIAETNKGIKLNKIMLGIPTYGYEYEITATSTMASTTKYIYKRVRSVTYKDAADLALSLSIQPQRNSAGELSFTYATSSAFAAGRSATRLVWFSDAQAIEDKIKLAKKLKLRGVVFFKLDGEADPAIWDKLK